MQKPFSILVFKKPIYVKDMFTDVSLHTKMATCVKICLTYENRTHVYHIKRAHAFKTLSFIWKTCVLLNMSLAYVKHVL